MEQPSTLDHTAHEDECCGSGLPRRGFLLTVALVAAGAVGFASPPSPANAAGGGTFGVAETLQRLSRGNKEIAWYDLVPGFVPETLDEDGWGTASGFDNGNPWGNYTAYLMATNAKGHRTWRVEQYYPNQVINGHTYSQGTTMWLFEGSALALLIDTGYPDPAGAPAPANRVVGQDDLTTVVKHLLGHENDGTIRTGAVDFVVANTHNHGDHTGKNSKMPERTIYFPALDWPRTNVPANYVPIVEGGGPTPAGPAVGSIALGDRSIDAINLYGHTAGSMGYLDRENNLFATGDALGSGFVYMQGGPVSLYKSTTEHAVEILRQYPHVAVLPAHFYQIKVWDRVLPPISGSTLDRAYVQDQLDAATGILDGTIIGEPLIVAGRTVTWARSNSAQTCYNLTTLYPGGPFGGSYGPDILRTVRIPGAYKTVEWMDSLTPAVHNIKTEFYLIRDNANTSMYLIKGSTRALLVGAGRGTPGTAKLARKLAGPLPLDVVVTSDDPDQLGGLSQFHETDIYAAAGVSLPDTLPKRKKTVEAGHVFNLGTDSAGRPALVEVVPLTGHSDAGLTLLSVSDRILFGGDALGEQFSGGGLFLRATPAAFDVAFRAWRTKTNGRYDIVYTARNSAWYTSPVFVDKIQEALGKALAGLPTIPSVRPAGYPMVQSSGPNDVIASIILAGP